MNIPAHVGIKIGGLFMVTIIMIIIFTTIYCKILGKKLSQALYTATLIQTLNGKGADAHMTSTEQMIISTQSIIAYMITSGLLIVSISFSKFL